MRSLFWPAGLLICLGVLTEHVLAVWFPPSYVPNLLFAGVLVLALSDDRRSTFWLVAATGAYMDLATGLLFGTYTLGFTFLYAAAQFVFFRFVPSEQIYVALPAAYVVGSVILLAWVFCMGAVASLLGWPITPSLSLAQFSSRFFGAVLGAVLSLGIYVVWLELLHRTGKSVRFKAQ